jgi:CPA1 family monovalent cation:H+ antiporter
MSELIQIEGLVLELLLIVSVVAILVRRFRIPYTVALVLVGLVLSFRQRLAIELTPDIILTLLLPPLVFEAAFHLSFEKLRRNLRTIIILAIPGVILNMLVVAGILSRGAGIPISVALVFGALIAATDPVSVVAIFRKLGAPKRLEILLEGESLFNDGTAIVLFSLALGALQSGHFEFAAGLSDFVRVGGGGLLVGAVLGWLSSKLIGQIDDYLVETTLTTVLAFGSYLVAEQLHLSGVLAVVAAGLMSGNIGEREMSPTTRIALFNFWEYVAFLANSAVFLLIGLDIEIGALIQDWQLILWSIAAVLIGRTLSIYGLSRLGREVPGPWRHVMFWGGLRGAIALALALSLPEAQFGSMRSTLIGMTYGVVLFSLVVQGMTMNTLIKRLKIITKTESQIEYERRHARALAARAGYLHLQRLSSDGLISEATWRSLEPVLKQRQEVLTGAVQEILSETPELEAEEIVLARKEMLRAQRSALGNLRRSGAISEESFEELVLEVDLALDTRQEAWVAELAAHNSEVDICQLLFVIVSGFDLESASNALAMQGLRVTRIRSKGGFLRRRNHLLMLGLQEGKLEDAEDTLRRVCRRKVEFVQPAMLGAGIRTSGPVQIEIHKATLFALAVERCEVI